MNASCQCGAISFVTPLPEPLALYICHCDQCKKQTASAFGCSAIFPLFPLPNVESLSCYTRPTASGHSLNCYFCKHCGTRIIHSTPGKNVLSVKGGCIDDLDWSKARHIWVKRAMVPIPEGVERDDAEPIDDPAPPKMAPIPEGAEKGDDAAPTPPPKDAKYTEKKWTHKPDELCMID